ncbi:MAG: ABC transporter permease, partial [Anaerovoracaceae bacterium]
MKQVFTVFKFTFYEAVRKKAFIISTIIMFVLVLGVSLVPKGIEFFAGDGKDDTEDKSKGTICYYIDEGNLIPGGEAALGAVMPTVQIEKGKTEEVEQYKERIKEKKNKDSLVLVTQGEGAPKIKVITKDFMSGVDVRGITESLSKAYGASLLEEVGVDSALIFRAQGSLVTETETAGTNNMGRYIIGMALTFVMFFMIYYYGYSVAMSVATEKASRVMETLVVSAKPSRILIGKILAMGTLGLAQVLALLLFSGICFRLFVPKDFGIGGFILSLGTIEPKAIVLLLIYFITGYVLYAVMNSVCGALVNKIEDLNSAMMPVTFIALIGFYLGYISSAVGSSGWLEKAAMYIPFSAPFVMPTKILNGEIAALDLAISLIILMGSIVLITL